MLKTGRKPSRTPGARMNIPLPLDVRIEDFYSQVEKSDNDQCWKWLGYVDKKGYGRFNFNGRQYLAHRFAYIINWGQPTKQCICHKCDNPGCVNHHHLFEGTINDNNQDMIRKGRFPQRWGSPKITPTEVAKIRSMYSTGQWTYKSLAENLNMPRTQIFSALNKWKTLPLYAVA